MSMRGIGLKEAAVIVAFAAGVSVIAASNPPVQPFAFLTPALHLNAADRGSLEAGKAVAKVLPSRDRELAVVAAVRINAPPERLISWMRRIAATQQGRYVPAVARFSSPPQIEDLDALRLDDGPQYLVYAHRSHVDVLDGVFGGLVRRIIERRVNSEAPTILNALRAKLEAGDPP